MRLVCLAALAGLGSAARAAVPLFRVQQPGSSAFFGSGGVSAFLERVDKELSELLPTVTEADWAYATNLTDANRELATAAQLMWNNKYLSFVNESRKYSEFPDLTEDEKRQLFYLRLDGSGTPTDPALQKELSEIIAKMTDIYSTATADGRPLNPDLEDIMATCRDPEILKEAYVGWRDATGPKMKADYVDYINLANMAARDAGFADARELWLSGYDMAPDDFAQTLDDVWNQVVPLYEQLHCYVRSKLTEKYGEEVVGTDGMIPGHLLGNMWAQGWGPIYDIVAPYPDIPGVDVTEELQKQGYDAVRMHKLAEEFYTSIGFDPLPGSFWKKSMLVKPDDRDAVCHASAWDFGFDDLRIKMCSTINHEELITVHHEQGHLMYDHAYGKVGRQPFVYRTGAADFFHEAIGDTIALSVVVPRHLKNIGLLPGGSGQAADANRRALINYQMLVALDKVPVLPWALLVDKWRWNVFNGTVTPETYNKGWWALVNKYQGVKSPVPRADDGFDAGAKFHIANNVPYARYFGAAILQFQLHEGLCRISGHRGPLSDCSIYKSKRAGRQLLEMLKRGRSRPWHETLGVVVGNDRRRRLTRQTSKPPARDAVAEEASYPTLDARALVSYFSPLLSWLRVENEGRTCGWAE